MKKILLTFALLFSVGFIFSQQQSYPLLSASSATATVTKVIPVKGGVGSVQLTTSSTFSTSATSSVTVTFQGSDNNSDWSTSYDATYTYRDTIKSASTSYVMPLNPAIFQYYKFTYNPGNANAGTVNATLYLNK